MSNPKYYTTNYKFKNESTTTPPPTNDLGSLFQLNLPIGTILMYGGTTLPQNYLWCDGASYSRATYSELFNIIQGKYGVPDIYTFCVPNMLKRIPIGSSATNSMGVNYQGASHVYSGNSQITSNQLAQHTHAPPANTQGYMAYLSYDPGTNVATSANGLNVNFGPNFPDLNQSTGYNTSNQEEFLPPFTAVNYIIKYA